MLSATHILDLPEALEDMLFDFLTPVDYMRFTGTCQQFKNRRSLNHAGMSMVKTSNLLSAVFDKHQNVLLHGPGGCGKTQMGLNALYSHAVRRNKIIYMTGTTGVSSCTLPSGMTIH